MVPKAQVTYKNRLNRTTSKLETLCNMILWRKWRGNSEWKKIFAIHILDKGLIPRMYKNFCY